MCELPDDAHLNSTPEQRKQEPWDIPTELAAQTLEVLSVMASEKALKEPMTVPRPEHLRPGGSKQGSSATDRARVTERVNEQIAQREAGADPGMAKAFAVFQNSARPS